MLVLALDTTIRGGSCALARDGAVLRQHPGRASESQASRLPRELMVLLEEAHTLLADVDIFAVATGPGSFTGLRVGIATMQGLAFAGGKPLIGVSTFDALAAIAAETDPESIDERGRPAGARGARPRIATWVDAWRGDVFAALYEGDREVEAPVVAHPDDLLAQMSGPCVFIGDGAAVHAGRIREALGTEARVAEPADPPLAGAIARLAAGRAAAGEAPPPHAIRPLYVRRSDAELARMAKDGGSAH